MPNYNGLMIVCVLALADTALGLACAFRNGGYKSSKLKQGLTGKAGYIAVCLLAAYLQCSVQAYPPLSAFDGVPLYDTCVCAIALIEISSVLENIVQLCPELKDAPFLKLFKGKEDS